MPCDVFAVSSSGETVRLGTVRRGRTQTLRVATYLVNRSVNVVARLLTRARVLDSGPLTFNQGDRVRVTLPIDERTLTVLPAP